MGISISYSLTLRDPGDLHHVLNAARHFAVQAGWQVQPLAVGLVLDPGANCEPLVLSPDPSGVLTDNVKTQFAGPAVHVQVVSLLDHLRPLLSTLEVVDDSEYWDTRSEVALREHFASEAALIAEARHGLAHTSILQALTYWLRIIGICIAVFVGVVGVILVLIWVTEHLGA